MRAALGLIVGLGIAALHGTVLTLANGDRLTGKVIARTGGKIYFHSDVLGDIVVAESGATIVENALRDATTIPSSTPGTPTASAGASSHAAARLASVPAPPLSPWTGKLEFGYDNAVAKVRTVNTALRTETEHKAGPDDLLLKGEYAYGISAGQLGADRVEGAFQWRHNLSDRLFSQTQTSYDSDQIRLVHAEYDQTADMGYHVLQNSQHTLDLGGGVNGQYLSATGIESGFNYLGNAFQNYKYKINSQYTFIEDASAEYSPASRGRFGILTDQNFPLSGSAQDYAYKFHTTLQSKINPHLSLNFHFEYEFDNAVLDPAARIEQRLLTTLGYAF